MEQTHCSIVRVMVIEDNPGDVELLRMALDGAGVIYEMRVIDDGAVALALFREESRGNGYVLPDVVVLDLNLPKYGGMEILEAACGNPVFAALPIVILSSSTSPREQSRIQSFAQVTYISKPPDLDQYLSIGPLIRDLVSERRGRKSVPFNG